MRSLKIRPKARPGRPSPRPPALLLISTLMLALASLPALGQTTPEPRREQLLNGLRTLLVHRPADPNVLVKLRVHSGAAFDLAGKEGMMSLLAAAMFDAEDFRFVEEDLGGRLEVKVDYDAINITVAAPARDFGRVIELLRSSLTNLQLTPEGVVRLRSERVERAGAEPVTAALTADRAAAARLFRPHPYARVTEGTPESLARVEYADLHLDHERFINPNNTTLVVVGGVEPKAVMRLLRQALGGWRKSDRLVPATFRRPEAPDARTLIVNRTGSDKYEVRLALAGLARTDRDRAAAEVLASLAAEHWRSASSELKGATVFARHESFRDGGLFRLGASAGSAAEAAGALAAAREVLRQLAAQQVTSARLEAARQEVAAAWARAAQGDEGAANLWLDAHTYDSTIVSGAEAQRALSSLTPAEVQRVAARLFQHTPAAAVAVGDAESLRAELARAGGVEIFGEAAGKVDAPPAVAPAAKDAPKQPAIQLKRPW
jgi:zinc protease